MVVVAGCMARCFGGVVAKNKRVQKNNKKRFVLVEHRSSALHLAPRAFGVVG